MGDTMRVTNRPSVFFILMALCVISGCGTRTLTATVQSITVSGQAAVRAGQCVTFAATVPQNVPDNLTRAVDGVQGGNASAGTIDSSGTYTAPAVIPSASTVTISVSSSSSSVSSASTTMTLLNPIPSLATVAITSVSPTEFSLALNGAGFVPGAQTLVNQTVYSTTQLSAISIQPDISQIDAQSSTITVQVQNPDPGASSRITMDVDSQLLLQPRWFDCWTRPHLDQRMQISAT